MEQPEVAGDAADPAGAGERPVALVVDDDADLADTYAIWLEDRCEVRTAYSGEAAVDALSEEIDVVLLDRRMPSVPGDEVLQELRDRGIDCQVSMLTAVEPDSDVVDLPFDEYLVKPVTKSDLLDAVDDLVLRDRFDEETQEYLALSSTEAVLEDREDEVLRDPDAVETLRERVAAMAEEEAVQQQVAELERLRRVNALVRETNRLVVGATSREEVERGVCDLLVSDGPYECAWVADYTAAFGALSFRAASPEAAGAEGDRSLALDGGAVERALDDGAVTAADVREEGAPLDVPLEGTSVEAAAAAAAVVPLGYRETVYGALLVYAVGDHEFTDRERTVLEEIGDAVANAINGIESEKLLFADTVVELELRLTDRADVFVDLSAALDCRVSLEGFVPTAEDGVTCYVTASGADADAVLERLAAAEAVRNARVVEDRGESVLFEATLGGSSVVHTLLGASASVESLFVDGGEGTVSATVAPEVDVRTAVEAVESRFPDTDLVSKRETERPFQSADGFRSDLRDRLTERQHAALEATFEAGYFEWPRASTAEEVAEALDLAPPTLHEHLREAQRKLVDVYLDEVGAGPAE